MGRGVVVKSPKNVGITTALYIYQYWSIYFWLTCNFNMYRFWPVSLNFTTSSLPLLRLSRIPKFLSFPRHCDSVSWHFLKTPGHYLGARHIYLRASCLPGAFLLDRPDSSSWLYCPGSECFMTYQTREAFLWMPGNWKQESDAYLRRKKIWN